MSAIDDMKAVLDAISDRKEELVKFEGLLSEVTVVLGDILACMERPDEDGDSAIATAILTGLKGLTIKAPDVHVNVQPVAPDVQVNVQPAQVVVMPSVDKPLTGWKLTITARDGAGAIRSISLTPEN